MKNIKQDLDDSLRPEYRRSDFGKLIKGKYASIQVGFAELVRLLIACIGENEGLTISDHSIGDHLAAHRLGDWTYEIDNANQITLRYWLNEFENLEEPLSNPTCVTTPQERSELQQLLLKHLRSLKAKVDAL